MTPTRLASHQLAEDALDLLAVARQDPLTAAPAPIDRLLVRARTLLPPQPPPEQIHCSRRRAHAQLRILQAQQLLELLRYEMAASRLLLLAARPHSSQQWRDALRVLRSAEPHFPPLPAIQPRPMAPAPGNRPLSLYLDRLAELEALAAHYERSAMSFLDLARAFDYSRRARQALAMLLTSLVEATSTNLLDRIDQEPQTVLRNLKDSLRPVLEAPPQANGVRQTA